MSEPMTSTEATRRAHDTCPCVGHIRSFPCTDGRDCTCTRPYGAHYSEYPECSWSGHAAIDLAVQTARREAEKERDEAREWAIKSVREVEARERLLTCAFCGEEYPPGTPPTQAEALTAHVMICAKHPIHALERDRDLAVLAARAEQAERDRDTVAGQTSYTAAMICMNKERDRLRLELERLRGEGKG